jgi:hypothetical protein
MSDHSSHWPASAISGLPQRKPPTCALMSTRPKRRASACRGPERLRPYARCPPPLRLRRPHHKDRASFVKKQDMRRVVYGPRLEMVEKTLTEQ